MVRQLGPFTFFVTFSSADLRWAEVIQAVARQYGVHLTEDDVNTMSWEDRCSWIRRNPVIVAREFDFRWKWLFEKLLKLPASTLGRLKDFIIKTEFQQRGSPHIHCLLWIEDAPRLETHSVETVTQFVDKYISCALPDDRELNDLVCALQTHTCSKRCLRHEK